MTIQAVGSVVITNVRIQPAVGPAVERGTIVVENGLITRILDQEAGTTRSDPQPEGAGRYPDGASVVDAAGCTAIPGMIDTHVHLALPGSMSFDHAMAEPPSSLAMRAPGSALQTLASGTTTVRDAGEIHGITTQLKRLTDEGTVLGPRLIVSGQVIVMTGGHGYFLGREADGLDEVRKAAREQLKAGADWIKLMGSAGFAKRDEQAKAQQLDLEEMRVAIHEGLKAGKPTMVHAHPAQAIKDAVRAGAKSIEHCSFPDDEAIDLMLEHDVTMVPTFTVYWEMLRASEQTVPREVIAAVEEAWDEKIACFQQALAAEVTMACGTDSGPPAAPHGNIARELELLISAGMSAERALAAATIDAARLLGLADSLGSIEVGKTADIVLLKGDPLADSKIYRNVERVFKGGVAVGSSLSRG